MTDLTANALVVLARTEVNMEKVILLKDMTMKFSNSNFGEKNQKNKKSIMYQDLDK